MTDKKNVFSNIVIVILTIILFVMITALIFTTEPKEHGYYTVVPAQSMLYSLERESYDTVLEDRYMNSFLSIDPEKNDAYRVPFAAADYYEAAFNLYGYEKAGRTLDAKEYQEKADASRQALGQYEYLADRIDEFLN
ncbi:MAG: hypothetical protein K5770_02985 [Lachnospiraceae bacterium]|nr:hypothetical protein [Lachnospiraceae bacterium]